MIGDELIEKIIIQLIFNKFSGRTEAYDMPLVELIDFYENLADEAERQYEEVNKQVGKQKGASSSY